MAAGEIYAFLGLNGAGKSTTIRMLLGMIAPTGGRAEVLGQQVRADATELWRRVGHMVETATAYPELTVREDLDVSRRLHGVRDTATVDHMIGQLGLAAYAGRRTRTLSLGNLQRLAIARALLHEPDLLILDEPANGLDPAGVVEIRELLRGLARDRGVTVFMSSHILAEVDLLATRIGIVHRGRLIEELDSMALSAIAIGAWRSAPANSIWRSGRCATPDTSRTAGQTPLRRCSSCGSSGRSTPPTRSRSCCGGGDGTYAPGPGPGDPGGPFHAPDRRRRGRRMSGLRAAIETELLKSRRSRVPWAVAIGFTIAPLVSGCS